MAKLIHVSLNVLRHRIAAYLGDLLHGRVRILGDVVADYDWPTREGHTDSHAPALCVTLRKLLVESPAGPIIARIPQVDLTVSPGSLLQGKIDVALAVLHAPQIELRRGANGAESWSGLDPGRVLAQRELLPERLRVQGGTIRLVDVPRKLECVVQVESARESEDPGQRQAFHCEIRGRRLGETIEGRCDIVATSSLRRHDVSYLIKLHLWCGDTHLKLDGSLADPLRAAVLDARLSLSGVTLARLFPFTGVVLPESPPFSIDGMASGTLGRQRTRLRYSDFRGQLGETDIRGTLEYERKKPRPFLRGQVYCVHLHTGDLRALLGTDSPQEQTARRGKRVQPPQKRVPVERFKTERWRNIDVDVEFSARHVIRAKKPEVDNLSVHVFLQEGLLELKPLRIGMAGGQLILDVRLDGREDIARGSVSLWARGLRMQRLFSSMSPAGARGQLYGEAWLEGRGNSIGALLASARGRTRWRIENGAISKLMMDEIGMRLCGIIAAALFGDREVPIQRGQAEFHGSEGWMEAGSCVLDTPDVRVEVGGYIDCANETFCLTIWPRNKGARFMVPRLPFVLLGTFNEPDLVINPVLTLLRPAAEIAFLGSVTPLVMLERLRGDGEKPATPHPDAGGAAPPSP